MSTFQWFGIDSYHEKLSCLCRCFSMCWLPAIFIHIPDRLKRWCSSMATNEWFGLRPWEGHLVVGGGLEKDSRQSWCRGLRGLNLLFQGLTDKSSTGNPTIEVAEAATKHLLVGLEEVCRKLNRREDRDCCVTAAKKANQKFCTSAAGAWGKYSETIHWTPPTPTPPKKRGVIFEKTNWFLHFSRKLQGNSTQRCQYGEVTHLWS